MSVLIKGVKMPYSCLACPLQKWKMCAATGYPVYDEIATQRRRSDCPLVEISTPHDELIDKTNLYNDMKNALNDYCNTSESIAGARTMMNCLSSVPTIIDKENES